MEPQALALGDVRDGRDRVDRVDEVVPTVATMAIGRWPAARSAAMAASSASGRIAIRARRRATRTHGRRARGPSVMHAFSIELCASAEA